jgi:hemin uptake protein HemP
MKKYKLKNISSDICSLKEQINVLKLLFWAFVLLLPALFHTPAAADFYENFESGSLSNWVIDGTTGTIEITTATSAEGSRSFHRYGGSNSTHSDGIHASISDFQPNYVSFYVRSEATNQSDCYFNLIDSGCGYVNYFHASDDSKFSVFPDDSSFVYSANVWYHIEFKNYDWSAKTFDYYVDGTLIRAGCSFRNQCSSVDSIELYNYHSSVHSYWDDIQITNLNSPPTDITLSNASIAENQSTGTTIGTFSTTDPDSGESFTYALVSGTGSTDNSSFGISGSNLETASIFNYESQSSYSIRVRTTDTGGETYEEAFTITITDANDPPTNITLSNVSIAENQSSGTTVGTFSTTDPDSGDSFTYALVSGTGSTDNSSFSISGSNLETAAIFNHEPQSSYSIRVRTTDSGGETYEEAFTITITDINEAPTISAISDQSSSGNSLTIAVNINDDDGDTLSLAAESSNLTLISNSNMTFSGTGYARTLTITPTADENGQATITVTVSDPYGLTSSTSFVVNVYGLIELPDNVTSKHNTNISIPVTLNNPSNLSIDSILCEMSYDAAVLTITSVSLTGTVLENENYIFDYNIQTPGKIIFGCALTDPYTGTGTIANLNFYVKGTDLQDSPLSLTIAEINDNAVKSYDGSFSVLPNEAPIISNIIDTHIYKNTSASIHFSVTEVESAPCSLTVTTSASDVSVVPNENISVACNDSDYTITITPTAWQVGSSTISISITDTGGLNSTSSFVFYVDNQDPIAGDGNPAVSSLTITTDEDTPITFVAGYDPDNDPLIINTVIEPLNATITFNSASNIMTYTPNVNYNGTETFVYQVFDGFAYDPYTVTVITNPVNDAPIIGIIPNQVTDEDTAAGPIGFTVADADGDNLTLSANSSNITLVAMDRIQFSGTGANRTISITPTANESGTVSITVMVNDSNGLTAITAFHLTVTSVNDSPVISSILDQTIDEDFATSPISFSITDADFDNLTLSTSSSNLSLVSDENIEISGTGTNRTIQITPKLNEFGSAIISISVTDGNLTDTSSFNLTVDAVNDLPVISTITDHTTNELTSYQINYTVTDIESTSLTVTAMSSDTILIPQNNLTITHTGENYTLSITPVMTEAGTTNITITLTDGEDFVDTVFMFTVEPVQFQISGYVGYYLDPANQPISNVALSLSGKFSYSAVTDSSGNYTLANVRPGNYTQTIEKSDETGGIALSDAISILKAAVSLNTLSCEQILAGDANMNDRITPLDAAKVSRLVAGMISNMNNDNIRWRFIPELVADCSSWPPIPFSNNSSLTITTDISGQDFIGILLGDVDGDWSP